MDPHSTVLQLLLPTLSLWFQPPACTDRFVLPWRTRVNPAGSMFWSIPATVEGTGIASHMPQVGMADLLQNLSWLWARAAEQGVNLGRRHTPGYPQCLQPSDGLERSDSQGQLTRERPKDPAGRKDKKARRGQTRTLLHQGAHSKPEAVEQCEVILHHLGARVAGVSIIPLIRAESAGQREAVRPSCKKLLVSNKYQCGPPTTPGSFSLLSVWNDRQGPVGTGFLPVLYCQCPFLVIK